MRKPSSGDFPDRVQSTIEAHRMFSAGDRVLIAVSGGPDSIALFQVLIELRSRFNLELAVFHLNHGLRPEAAAEAEQVVRFADERLVPVYVRVEDVRRFCSENGLGRQAGAREVRYGWLRRLKLEYGFNKIATGHTADDVVETFLMRLIRGSGLTGLSSIPPVRDGDIVRPLIEIERPAIIDFLNARDINYIDDPSNRDRKYARNRIRHDLVPQLTALNPRFKERVLSTVKIVREEEALIAGIADDAYGEVVRQCSDEAVLDLSALRQLGAALGRRVLRRAVFEVGGRADNVGFDHFDSIWRELVEGGLAAYDLPGRVRVVRERGTLVVYRVPLRFSEMILHPGEKTGARGLTVTLNVLPRGEIELAGDSGSVFADAAEIVWPLKMRSVAPGDWFRPLGLGGTKKIHDYFIDAKIPLRHRPTVPVFADGEKVIAVGSRIDERVKVTDKTMRVAVIEAARDGGLGAVRGMSGREYR